MNDGIRERVEALRREIAELQELNLAYLRIRKPGHTERASHTRRKERLKAIMRRIEVYNGSGKNLETLCRINQVGRWHFFQRQDFGRATCTAPFVAQH